MSPVFFFFFPLVPLNSVEDAFNTNLTITAANIHHVF